MKSRASRPEDKPAETAVLSVRIQPRASKNKVSRNEDGSWKIWLTAPPVDGAANEALIKYLGSLLGVAKSQVEIATGLTSKNKIVRVSGIGPDAVNQLLSDKGK